MNLPRGDIHGYPPQSEPPQYRKENHGNANKQGTETPKNLRTIKPRRLFKKNRITNEERNLKYRINPDIEEMDLQILLLNTLTIDASKVQVIVNEFIQGETHSSIFCFTETKVDNPDFKPIGLKIFTKQRRKREKKGGGLRIGYKEHKKIIIKE